MIGTFLTLYIILHFLEGLQGACQVHAAFEECGALPLPEEGGPVQG